MANRQMRLSTEGSLHAENREDRFRQTLDNLMEGCQIIDFDWRYIYVNESVARHGRRRREELLGRRMWEAYPGIENTELFTILKRCMEERVHHLMENRFENPDGAMGWFELSIQPVPEGLLFLSIDITERRLAEEQTRKQLERVLSLREIDLAILSSFNLDTTLNVGLNQVMNLLKVDAVDVMLLEPESSTLKFAFGHGFRSRDIERGELNLGEGHGGRAALDQRRIHVTGLDRLTGFVRASLLEGEGFVSYIGTPLVSKGKVLGVLEIFHRSTLEPDADWFDFLDVLAGQIGIAVDNSILFNNLQRSNSDLILAYETTLEGWSAALDLRDRETEGHTLRVTGMTLDLARRMGVGETELIHIRRGALLHDIGKMGVPDHILLKPDALTSEEWESMRMHPVYAYDLLSKIAYLHDALDIPYCHHERWDGTGYPRQLKGTAIPLAARIFAVVDVYDALTSDRPYRKGWSREKTLDYIREQSGKQFDPQVVRAFLTMIGSA
jgi:PAS domain S-box-containing protein